MSRARPSRLWTPLMAGVGGAAISLSVGLGRHTWEAIVIGGVVTALAVLVLYLAAAGDSDVGAVLGNRADERQQLVRLKASRVSAVVAVAASVIACVIAAAAGSDYWPFEVIYIVTGLSYLISLWLYGADRDAPAGTAREGLD